MLVGISLRRGRSDRRTLLPAGRAAISKTGLGGATVIDVSSGPTSRVWSSTQPDLAVRRGNVTEPCCGYREVLAEDSGAVAVAQRLNELERTSSRKSRCV